MAKYKDKLDREWELELDYALADVVKTRHEMDLLDMKSIGRAFVEFAMSDMRKFGELLYTLCEEQIKARGLSPEDFGRAHNGPTLLRAKDALEDCIADFSQSPQVAEAKRKLFRASNQVATDRIEKLSESNLREQMLEHLDANTPQSPTA